MESLIRITLSGSTKLVMSNLRSFNIETFRFPGFVPINTVIEQLHRVHLPVHTYMNMTMNLYSVRKRAALHMFI
jgi:hypothetical protein